jgi:aminoglycoside phosphotransferase (APT) family kinase protein
MTRMHPDEVETDVALVRGLLAGQFPRWAGLPIDPVESYGTDHDIYRLGDHLAVRLPRIGWATAQAHTEAKWLPRLAPQLPLALPVQLARGRPAEGYPFGWSVYEWLPGENANGTIGDLEQAAVDLAGFVRALRRVDTTGAHPRHPHGRGGPLAQHDEHVRRSVAVDPACDLQPAWNLFAGPSRARFRDELAVDDASWLRGRGWALLQAVVALPYYWDTNPGMVRQASHAVAQVLADRSPD